MGDRLVEEALVDQAVVAEGVAVVAGEDDQGVVQRPRLLQRRQDLADALVDQGDVGVVAGPPAPVVLDGDVREVELVEQALPGEAPALAPRRRHAPAAGSGIGSGMGAS